MLWLLKEKLSYVCIPTGKFGSDIEGTMASVVNLGGAEVEIIVRSS